MLHLIQSNKMARLAEHLVSLLQTQQKTPETLLQPDTILVQSPGMAQWLKLTIAEQTGIAANVDFPLPSSYIWQLYRKYIDDLPEQSAFTKPNLTWKLMALLPDKLAQPEFASINSYLEGEDTLKLFHLCHKIADVFDQYLVYRPEWLERWEQGENTLPDVDIASQPWQPVLWRALVDYSNSLGESPYHRANLHTQLQSTLYKETADAGVIQQPLYVFGISAIPQQQLEILEAIAQQTEVFIFWCNPSHHYWGDIVDEKTLAKLKLSNRHNDHSGADKYRDVGNPLLASWGKLGRDYQDMLVQTDAVQHDDFVEVTPSTLLEHVQHEIFELQYRGATQPLDASELISNGEAYPKIEIDHSDNSLEVHACHSVVRELEVLKDYLLGAFEQDPSLRPADIIVMMPDVTAYAPYIDGVFSKDKTTAIPYAVSDRNLADESDFISSFLSLMTLHQGRFALSELLAVLDVPAIRRKLTLSDLEYEQIKFWLSDVGVRWGWDGEHKSRWDLPELHQNTWLFGLQRLLVGYAQMPYTLFRGAQQSIAPYPHVEGQQAQALGKLYGFCQQMIAILQGCDTAATLFEKVTFALEVLDSLYEAEEREQLYMTQLRQSVEQLKEHQAQFEGEVSQDVFVAELNLRLQEKGVGQRFLAGAVNFCTLMPMRSIPFRKVCILGMNESDYPRQTVPIGFDLMRQAQTRRGDRSRRHDDRYLFLEAVLSAQEALFISYQGASQRDNAPFNPSILLSELLEYCEYCFCLKGDMSLKARQTRKRLLEHLIVRHPLQPFSMQYFNDGNLPVSFANHWFDVARQHYIQNSAEQEPPPAFWSAPLPEMTDVETDTVSVSELVQFFQNPARAFFRQRWNTGLDLYTDVVDDSEPFALDPLQRYQLGELLMFEESKHAVASLQAQGLLPDGTPGKISLDELSKSLDKQKQQFDALREGQDAATVRVDISLADDTISVTGACEYQFGTKLIHWRPGRLRGKDKLKLFIQWLVLCAMPHAHRQPLQRAHFIASDKVYTLEPIEPVNALNQLQRLVHYWQRGAEDVLLFFPESACTWVEKQDEQKVLQSFIGTDFSAGEGAEPHIARVCPDLAANLQVFQAVAQDILGMMHAHVVKK